MTLAAPAFIEAVAGFLRITERLRGAYLEDLLKKTEINGLAQTMKDATARQSEEVLIGWMRKPGNWPIFSGRFPGLGDLFFDPNANTRRDDLNPEEERLLAEAIAYAQSAYDDALERYIDEADDKADGWFKDTASNTGEPVRVLFEHGAWVAEGGLDNLGFWVAREIGATVLKVFEADPTIIGAGPKTQTFLTSLAPTLEEMLKGGSLDVDKSLVKAFVDSSLDLVIAHPGILSGDEKLQPLVTGVLEPVRERAKKDGGRYAFLWSKELKSFLSGPLAFGVVGALDKHSDLYLRGEFKKGGIAGEVLRAVLEDFVAGGANDFDLRTALSDASLPGFVDTLLSVVGEHPEFVVGGEGEVNDALRDFFKSATASLRASKTLFQQPSDALTEVLTSALSTSAAIARIRMDADWDHDDDDYAGKGWANVWRDVAGGLIDSFVGGLSVRLNAEPGAAASKPLLSESDFAEIFKTIAEGLSARPDILLDKFKTADGGGVNARAQSLVQTLASTIAEDELNLLSGEDWRKIVGLSLELAAEDTAALFSFDTTPGGDPVASVFADLTASMLKKASASVREAEGRPGGFLFGATLRAAVMETLEAASGTLFAAMTGEAQKAHIAALEDLIDMLGRYRNGVPVTLDADGAVSAVSSSANADTTLRLGAREWLRVYKHFIPHVLQNGPKDPITTEDVAALMMNLNPTADPAAA
ncbi:MAG: hypothetical protein AAF719_05580 [Pseudomonadota bacterium]